jgi:hypothetical protein
MGVGVYLLAIDRSEVKAPSTCFAGIEHFTESLLGEPDGIEAIARYCEQVRATALVALAESHCLWLARNKGRFDGICKLLIPDLSCLERLASKIYQVSLAREAGFTVLPTHVIRNVEDLTAIQQFPVCLRPATPNASNPPFKVLMARSPEELRGIVQKLRISGDGLLAQPFRVLPNMVVHCSSREGGELMSATAFLADRKFEGLALRVRPMPLPDRLGECIRRFSSKAGLCGPYHFDFLYCAERDEAYYLEVNTRFGGTTDKVIWLGVNEPANCLAAYGLTPPRGPRSFTTGSTAVVNKRATLKHLFTMLRQEPAPWDYPQESRVKAAIRSAGDFLLAKDSIFDRKDLEGTLAFHLQGLVP